MAEVLTNSHASIITSNGFPSHPRCLKMGYLNCRKKPKFNGTNHARTLCTDGFLDFQGARVCGVGFLTGFTKLRKLVDFGVMVASVEYELVCELGEIPLIEEQQQKQQFPKCVPLSCGVGRSESNSLALVEAGSKRPLWGNSTLDRGVECDVEYGLVCEQEEFPLIEEEEEEEEEEEKPLWGSSALDRGVECDVGSSSCPSMVSKWDTTKLCYLEERDEETLSKRILALSRTNKSVSALTLLKSMEFAGLKPSLHACNSLLSCLARNDMIDELLHVFGFMKHNKITSGHSCTLVLKALTSSRGSEVSLQMFSEWERESEMSQSFDVIVYNTMISISGKENKWIQMEKIWKSLRKSGNIGTTVTYRVLVCTFVRCEQYEMAIDAYIEMLQNGIKPAHDSMQAIIGAYAKEEEWDLALSVFYHMLKCGLKPNLIACNALINSLGKVGKVKEAFNVYKHIRSLGHEPDSYTWNSLLGAFYRANQFANALQLFDRIQKDFRFEPNVHMYNTALMCCQRLSFWDKALQLLWKMESSGIPVSTASYNIVISACEVARKPKVGLQVYEHMIHNNCSPDTFTYLSLIRSCIWGDLWDEVDDILDHGSTPSVSLYNAAIHGMCLRRRYDSAKKLYLKMRDIGLIPDGKTRALMLQYMKKRSS